MSNPFDESDDEDLETNQQNEGLVINKSFADKFESQERKKDLLRAKELLDDDDESDSESEDDEGELISTSLDIEIVKVINRIRKKDPKIYDKTTTWFQRNEEEIDSHDNDSLVEKNQKKKRYKDILREQLLKHGADIQVDDSGEYNSKSAVGRNTGALAYDEEQQKIRRDFLLSVGGGDDEDDEDDIMKVRARNPAEKEQEEQDLKEAMAEMRELGVASTEIKTEEADAFLLDYMEKKQWKSNQKYNTKEDSNVDDSEDGYEEDEEELDKVDLFEHKYNFRFEELQGDNGSDGSARSNVIGMGLQSLQVTGHARNVEGSLRRVDEKRKTQRESRKLNKEKEKRQKEAELKRLKSLKNQEMQEKLKQICAVSGIEGDLGFGEDDLDEDWDPVKYEAMMQAQFGDDYYGEEDATDFAANDNGEGTTDWDGDDTVERTEEEDYLEEGNDEDGGEDRDEDFDDGSGGHNEGKSTSKSKIVNGMLDELYKLDYEDIIAGMPCRFKYRQVEKEDFGLTADEILLADDSELNKFVSLKKISAYSEAYGSGDQAHKVAKKRKRMRVAIKERLQKEADDAAAAGLEIKGLKKKISKDQETKETKNEEVLTVSAKDVSGKKRRRRKLKEVDEESASASSSTSVPEPVADICISEIKVKEVKVDNSAKKSDSKKSSGKDDRAEISRKKKRTAMAAAPVARHANTPKPKSSAENLQRRASLYK